MPTSAPKPPSWLRTILTAVAMGGGAVMILIPAWLPDKPTLPVEDSAVEILQSALLGFAAALFLGMSPYAGPFRPVYRALALLAIAALIAEIGDAIDGVIAPLRHELAVAALFIWAGLTLLRNHKSSRRFITFAARNPASGFLLSATILVYAFSRAFGSDAFWAATLNGAHHPDTPSVCQAYLELLACYFVLLGAIGFCLPLNRRRHRMTTKP